MKTFKNDRKFKYYKIRSYSVEFLDDMFNTLYVGMATQIN